MFVLRISSNVSDTYLYFPPSVRSFPLSCLAPPAEHLSILTNCTDTDIAYRTHATLAAAGYVLASTDLTASSSDHSFALASFFATSSDPVPRWVVCAVAAHKSSAGSNTVALLLLYSSSVQYCLSLGITARAPGPRAQSRGTTEEFAKTTVELPPERSQAKKKQRDIQASNLKKKEADIKKQKRRGDQETRTERERDRYRYRYRQTHRETDSCRPSGAPSSRGPTDGRTDRDSKGPASPPPVHVHLAPVR